MKIKNVMFSGVMAAILMSVAGAANAADPISVASTGYVEAKVGALETSVQGAYQTKADAKTAADAQKLIDDKQTQDIKSNTEAINMLGGDSGAEGVATLVSDVNTNKTAISTLNADAQTEGSVAYKIAQAVSDEALSKYTTDAELEGKGYQTAGDVQATIDNLKLGETYATVSALDGVKATAEAAQTAEEVGSAIDTKISDLKLGETYQAKLDETQMKAVNSGVTEEKVSGYDSAVLAVNNETSGLGATYTIATGNQGAIATLNGGADQAGSVANTAKTTVEGYAVPKPGDNCAHAKCVLSVDQGGNPYWMELALSL